MTRHWANRTPLRDRAFLPKRTHQALARREGSGLGFRRGVGAIYGRMAGWMDGRPLGRLEPLLTEMLQAQRRWMGWLTRPEKKSHQSLASPRQHAHPIPPPARTIRPGPTDTSIGRYSSVLLHCAMLSRRPRRARRRASACLPACLPAHPSFAARGEVPCATGRDCIDVRPRALSPSNSGQL